MGIESHSRKRSSCMEKDGCSTLGRVSPRHPQYSTRRFYVVVSNTPSLRPHKVVIMRRMVITPVVEFVFAMKEMKMDTIFSRAEKAGGEKLVEEGGAAA
jgi:hypothetical protein